MIGSDGSFFFYGRNVCSTLILLLFSFTRPMQSCIRILSIPDNDNPDRIETGIRINSSVSVPICTISAPQRDAFVSFLEKLAECTANRMSDAQEIYLPVFRKRFVFKIFSEELKLIFPINHQPTMSYFLKFQSPYT